MPVFAATLDSERSEIMVGIDRYGRKQKELAAQVRKDAAAASALASTATDAKQVDDANQQLAVETRVFNERRASLSFVCEVPTMISSGCLRSDGRSATRCRKLGERAVNGERSSIHHYYSLIPLLPILNA